MAVVLGQADPLAVPPPASLDNVCSAMSDTFPGLLVGFICTRSPGHTGRDPEHVASADYECGDLAIAAWTDGSAPRVIDDSALARARRTGRPS